MLVTAQTTHQIGVAGPTLGSYSHQRQEGDGYDLAPFVLDWEAEQARCPQGQTSVKWWLGTPPAKTRSSPFAALREVDASGDRPHEFATSHHAWWSPPRMNMCDNCDWEAGPEVV